MEAQTSKDGNKKVIAVEIEEIELDLEVLEEVIAPITGPCNRK
jgi:hypothetical protein